MKVLQLIEKSTNSCLTLLKRTVLVTNLSCLNWFVYGRVERSGLKFENVGPTFSCLTVFGLFTFIE